MIQEPERRPSTIAWLMALAVLLWGVINLFTLDHGHPAGGDFAQYIIHAQNLWHGLPYRNGVFVPQVPFHNYPPGYPAMLIPLLALGGVNLMLLKSLNLVFWPLYCWVLFVIFRRRLGQGAAFYAFLFMLFCPWFFLFKQSVLSDVPFTFLVTAALWALINWRDGGRRQYAWLTLFLACAFASLLVRSAGLALVGAALLVMVFQRRAWGAAAVTVAVFVAAGLLQSSLGASTSGYFHLLHDPVGWLSKVAFGLPSKVAKVVGFYFPVYRGGHPLAAALEALAALPLLALAAWGWWRRRRRLGGWDGLDAFVVLYLLMILAWPFVEGPRLFAPVAGLLLLYFAEGLEEFFAGRRLPAWLNVMGVAKAALMAGLLVNLLNTGLLWEYDGDIVNRPGDRELYAWVREHAAQGRTYLIDTPRVMALFSGRVGDKYYPGEDWAAMKARMRDRGVGWLILRRPAAREGITSARKQYAWLFPSEKAGDDATAKAQADPQLSPAWSNRLYRVYGLD
ncbi:MAG: glycosyltransferase family 39 protein [Desulfarculus sp.]|nr:glycosyltransferase family 39 protein [Pseudomonadota bacterium]MBV1714390.1 glycosyltransferase family 39 protein [Desulfarculus sp.]MBU4573163.1 glycosyltransferase family 39 protein [Pseudomonadota bacterium]MBU4597945.1 glycosyltransferase family 39 protein [Pseudomonadota bacterium]MBV1738246.1 glycosyltransferase family 39 protein [Desulfarculus sp.]